MAIDTFGTIYKLVEYFTFKVFGPKYKQTLFES